MVDLIYTPGEGFWSLGWRRAPILSKMKNFFNLLMQNRARVLHGFFVLSLIIVVASAIAIWKTPPSELLNIEAVSTPSSKKPVKDAGYISGELLVKLKDDYASTDILSIIPKYKVKKLEKVFKKVPSSQLRLDGLKEQLSSLESQEGASEIKKAELRKKIQLEEKLAALIKNRKKRAPKGVKAPKLDNIYLLKFDEEVDIEQVLTELSDHLAVEYAEPNYKVETQMVPNDPLYNQQWAHQNIQSEAAWDIASGQNTVIAIVDTGIDYNHEDLMANMWFNGAEIVGNGIDDDGNGYVDDYYGYDFQNNDGDPRDDNGHGTHCAGIVAAVANNAKGIAGVSHRARIMTLKFLNQFGTGLTTGAASSIIYAADNGADIISNSWGGSGYSQVLEDAVNYAYSQGCLLTAAAGNDGSSVTYYPAGFQNMLSVAAVDNSNNKASFSNFGSWVDVAAPGVNILSTLPQYEVYLNQKGYSQNYDSLSGTSMACPYTAGEAALVLSDNPEYSPEQVERILKVATGSPLQSGEYIGTGLINLLDALTVSAPPNAVAEIADPLYDLVVGNEVVSIKGSATGVSYIVEYSSEGPYSANWVQIGTGGYVENGELAQFNTEPVGSGYYHIRLSVTDSNNFLIIDQTKIYVDKDLLSGWPQELKNSQGLNDIIYSSPIAADFDGDREIEILGAGYSSFGEMTLWNLVGSILPGWPKTLGGRAYATPVAEDLDGDGNLEIILFRGYMPVFLYIWHHDGTDFLASPKFFDMAPDKVGSPSVGDINGDGELEIVVSMHNTNSTKVTIFALDLLGNVLPGWPYEVQGQDKMYLHDGTVALADFDQDGDEEIVASSYQKSSPEKIYIHVLDEAANLLPGWPQERNVGGVSRPSVADIDDDGDLEIFFGTGTGGVYGLDHQGNNLSGWPRGNVSVYSGITLADLDGNSDLEIICQAWDSDVFVYHHNGSLASGWPKNIGNIAIAGPGFYSSPIVVDINGDNRNDILVGSAGSSELYAFDEGGQLLEGFPKRIGNDGFAQILSTPTAADFDNDGNIDLVVGGRDGRVYLWNLANTFTDIREWPVFAYGLRNTSHYKVSPKPPVSDAGLDQIVLEGEEVSFDGSGSFDTDGTIVSYQWDFGDESAASGMIVGHSYPTAGSYIVTLTVMDNDGLSDADDCLATVEANNSPVADAGLDQTAMKGEMIAFDGSGSFDSDGSIVSYQWAFGDGNTDSGMVVTHSYSASGIYIATLTVTDNGGLTGGDERVITIESEICGNGYCAGIERGEDCNTCPTDCHGGQGGVCSACWKGRCDGSCDPKRERSDCADCASSYCCGDGVCNEAEGTTACQVDCGCSADSDCNDGEICTVDVCNLSTGICDNNWPECGANDGCCGPECSSATDLDCPVEIDCSTCFKGVCDGICHPKREDASCPDC